MFSGMLQARTTRRFWLLVGAVGVAGGLTGAAYVVALKAVSSLLGPDAWSRWWQPAAASLP
jgi:hypothetical protein